MPTTLCARDKDVLESFALLPGDAYVSARVAGVLFGNISAVTIWRWTRSGALPAPCKLGGRLNKYRVGDLRAALAARPAEAPAPKQKPRSKGVA